MGLATALGAAVTFGAIVLTIFGAFGLGAFTEVGGGAFVETLGAGGGVLKTDSGLGLAIVTRLRSL